MSLFIKRYGPGTCYRCINTINTYRIQKSCRLPLLRNLGTDTVPDDPKSFSSDSDLPATSVNVRKYLDYLTNVYKNDDQVDHAVLDIIQQYSTKNLLSKRIAIKEDIENLEELDTNDNEMKKLKEEEEREYKSQLEKVDEELLNMILKNIGRMQCTNIILEISAGVGGQEAMLFVKDLYNMYIGYLDYLRVKYDVIETVECDQGGLRHVSLAIEGENAYEKLRYEGGVHRVQRIPATEKSGRIHTSVVSVAVFPEPSDIEINLNERDLKIETKRASGAGGQHVNTTDSAIRITHLPTGIVVNSQAGRSQIKNKQWALLKLKSLLYEQQLNTQNTVTSELRKKQMGMGLRNEKIRTYNYNQDRITDHRIPNATMHHLKEFMQGGAELEELQNRLHKDMQMKILLELMVKLERELK